MLLSGSNSTRFGLSTTLRPRTSSGAQPKMRASCRRGSGRKRAPQMETREGTTGMLRPQPARRRGRGRGGQPFAPCDPVFMLPLHAQNRERPALSAPPRPAGRASDSGTVRHAISAGGQNPAGNCRGPEAQAQPVEGVGGAARARNCWATPSKLDLGDARRAGRPTPCRWSPGRDSIRIPAANRAVIPSAVRCTCASREIAALGDAVRDRRRRCCGGASFSSARMRQRVGPTQAAVPGTQGQPANSCSGGMVIAQKPLPHPVERVDSSPMRAEQPGWRAAALRRPAMRGAAARPARSPRCSGRLRPAGPNRRRPVDRRQSIAGRVAAACFRRPPAEPSRHRP